MPRNENETRKDLIDPKLKQAGLNINYEKGVRLASTVCIETKIKFADGNDGYVDYVIFGREGKPLAVIEAKKSLINEEVGRAQACFYADALEREYGIRPIIYYTNGYNIKIIDGRYPARAISGFHRMDELEYLIERRNHVLKDVEVNPKICDRYYQKDAIQEVIDHFTKKNSRSLIVLATGTGKTRVSCALSDIFIRNNYVKRILFLADRKNLIRQAKEETFDKLLTGVSTALIADGEREGADTARIVFSTYQSMISIIKDTTKCPYGVSHFSIIVVDESHRAIFSKYAEIFKYFDALMIGLTATPRADVGKNTYQVFNLESETPNYEYDLLKGVQDGYLNYYRALDRTPNLLKNGLVYETLSEEEKEQFEEKFSDDDFIPDKIEGKHFYSTITNIDTIRQVLRTLMDEGLKVNNGDLLGKSIIFARDHNHAILIMEEFRKMYPELCSPTGEGGVDYCIVIDNQIKYNEHLQREFKEKQKIRIVISVDIMTTGVDIPEVVNLVLFNRIASKTKFWQIVGRGTRLCKNLNVLSPSRSFFERHTDDSTRTVYKDKQGFLIFDICNVFEFFKVKPDGNTTLSADATLSDAQNVLLTQMELYKQMEKNYNNLSEDDKTYMNSLKESFHYIVENFNDNYFGVQINMKFVEKYRDLGNWHDLDILELKKHIIPLYNGDAEEKIIKRWDMMCNKFATSKYGSQADEAKLADMIFTLVNDGLIRTKMHIPAVKNKEKSLKYVASEEFLNIKSPAVIEKYRDDLRELMPFIEKKIIEPIVSDFDDFIVGDSDADTDSPFPEKRDGIKISDFDTFDDKVKKLISNSTDAVINKIANMERISSSDIINIKANIINISESEYNKVFKIDSDLVTYLRKNIDISEESKNQMIKELNYDSKVKNSYIEKVINYYDKNGILNRSDFISEELNALFVLSDLELVKLLELLESKGILI